MSISKESLHVEMGIAAAAILTAHHDKSTSAEKQALLHKLGDELTSQFSKLALTHPKDAQGLKSISDVLSGIRHQLELTTLLGHVLDQALAANMTVTLSNKPTSMYSNHNGHVQQFANMPTAPVPGMIKGR